MHKPVERRHPWATAAAAARTGLLMLVVTIGLLEGHPVAAQVLPRASKETSGEIVSTLSGSAEVLEGDLLAVNGSNVRLYGVDAPDPGQMCLTKRNKEYDCFAIAQGVLKGLVGSNPVECQMIRNANPRLPLGICRVKGVDLGGSMVARGWAFAYRALSHKYTSGEAFAQSRARGMWAGRVEYPWLWRDRQAAAAAAEKKAATAGKGKPGAGK